MTEPAFFTTPPGRRIAYRQTPATNGGTTRPSTITSLSKANPYKRPANLARRIEL